MDAPSTSDTASNSERQDGNNGEVKAGPPFPPFPAPRLGSVDDRGIMPDRGITPDWNPPDGGDLEPYCARCGDMIGIFIDHGDGWHHFRGSGTVADPSRLYESDHEPVVAWRDPARLGGGNG